MLSPLPIFSVFIFSFASQSDYTNVAYDKFFELVGGWGRLEGRTAMVRILEHYHPNLLWNFFHALGIIAKVISFTAFFNQNVAFFCVLPYVGTGDN